MCLIAFAWRCHPQFPLVVAANRDEYHERSTAPAAFWPDSLRILAGRDLLGGGTWLGISRGGRFAALTNLPPGRDEWRGGPSRGLLVSGFLSGTDAARTYLTEVAGRAGEYNGFCLVVNDGAEMGYYCTGGAGPSILAPGIYGLGNAPLDAPWPKVSRLKSGLAEVLSRAQWGRADLMALLGDRTPPPAGDSPHSGEGDARPERVLAPVFIAGAHYGTRSSTVLRVDAGGRADFTEQSFGPGGGMGVQAHFSFLATAEEAPALAAR